MDKKNNYIDEDFIIESTSRSIIDKIFVVISKIIGICILILFMDFMYTLIFSNKPILTIKKEDNKYVSLLYDVYICDNTKVIKFKTQKYSCPLNNYDTDSTIDYSKNDNTNDNNNIILNSDNVIIYNKRYDITIIDNSDSVMCDNIKEYYYEDDNYKYYFNCNKSEYMYIVTNNKRYKFNDALENNIVTIDNLISIGYDIIKEDKSNINEE